VHGKFICEYDLLLQLMELLKLLPIFFSIFKQITYLENLAILLSNYL